ncbi:hypothetical protein HYX04_05165 [Candidatus Woesearchaeota archaeon]|nr:hypothetical protein [Candidatus Woesearchaeota archaeon]
MKKIFIGFALASIIILIASCTAQQVSENKVLDTAISPARDLTGVWEGTATWKNNVLNPACSYEGAINFNFAQKNNELEGTWHTTITKINHILKDIPCGSEGRNPEAILKGTISSSTAKFSSGPIDFSATFTTDLMEGAFESCPDQICSDGTRAVGAIGKFSATRKE